MCIAIISMASCSKQLTEEKAETYKHDKRDIVYNLNATHYDKLETRAVKTGWEQGDIIYVFFSEQTSPSYLEMSWDGGQWKCLSRNNLTLVEGETGVMRAVYLPFGNNESIIAAGDNYRFQEDQFSYYLTSTLPYVVTNDSVSGTFDMRIPEGFVQFFIDDEAASDNTVIELREPHLQPRAIDYIDKNGIIHEKIVDIGAPVKGYVYDKSIKTDGESKGYLFSANLMTSAQGKSTDYLFTVVSGGASGNYYTRQFQNKVIYSSESSGRAIKLPGLDNWNLTKTHKPIDLGIVVNGKRVYWSRCNLGAATETDGGDHYAWGEIAKKNDYVWATYKYGTSITTLTKYNTKKSNGKVDNLTELQLIDDVVNVKLGGNRRIPTDAEWTALRENCTWTWKTTTDGYACNGYLIKGKGDYSSNSIFLPAAGVRRGTELIDYGIFGGYWSSSLVTDSPENALRIGFHEEAISRYSYYRSSGMSIRPVME